MVAWRGLVFPRFVRVPPAGFDIMDFLRRLVFHQESEAFRKTRRFAGGVPEDVVEQRQSQRSDHDGGEEEDVLGSGDDGNQAEQEDDEEVEYILLHLLQPKYAALLILGNISIDVHLNCL